MARMRSKTKMSDFHVMSKSAIRAARFAAIFLTYSPAAPSQDSGVSLLKSIDKIT